MDKNVAEWLDQADYDLDTAKVMLKDGRYIYVVFMCHMALEKALKGLIVGVVGEAPPRSHNLLQLVKISEPKLTVDQIAFLTTINTASIATRYPEELRHAVQHYSKNMAEKYFSQTEEVIKCLRSDQRLN
jgi:HEPN domain-containing protein